MTVEKLDELNATLADYLSGNANEKTIERLTALTPDTYISFSRQSGYFVAMGKFGPLSNHCETLADALFSACGCDVAFDGDESKFIQI